MTLPLCSLDLFNQREKNATLFIEWLLLRGWGEEVGAMCVCVDVQDPTTAFWLK